MEDPGDLILPTVADVVRINLEQYAAYGGLWYPPDNLKDRKALEGILDYIQNPPVYDESFEGVLNKAARYGWHLTRGHYFHDGNKRTGLETLLRTLEANGVEYDHKIDEELVRIGLLLADGRSGFTFEDLRTWVQSILIES